MSMRKLLLLMFVNILLSGTALAACPDYLDTELRLLHSDKTVNICKDYGDKTMLIVNTASKCGFTPQFEGLEALHNEFKDKGLLVLGFPSDSFNQEIKNEADVAEVCYMNYGVTFTMLSTVSVRGNDAHPIFKALAKQSEAPGWNFNKYLVDKNGKVLRHFGSRAQPDSEEFREFIRSAL